MNDYLPLNKGLIFNLTVPNYTKPLPVLPINQIKPLHINHIYSIKVN